MLPEPHFTRADSDTFTYQKGAMIGFGFVAAWCNCVLTLGAIDLYGAQEWLRHPTPSYPLSRSSTARPSHCYWSSFQVCLRIYTLQYSRWHLLGLWAATVDQRMELEHAMHTLRFRRRQTSTSIPRNSLLLYLIQSKHETIVFSLTKNEPDFVVKFFFGNLFWKKKKKKKRPKSQQAL